MSTGKFITFEGGEGAGKSTQVRLLSNSLQRHGKKIVMTREPGGSIKAEAIRKLLLEGRVAKFGPFAEALLFSLARDDHLESVIRPTLNKGSWVICDRFMDSTLAYQGAGGNLPASLIRALERTVVGDTIPDLTILIDLPPEIGIGRAQARQKQNTGGDPDRFEAMNMKFHTRLRKAFLDIAENAPDRCVVFDGQAPPDELAKKIWDLVSQRYSLAPKIAM
ncbi:MAG: dTMP kinase [bacterium]|nr:dTMP kinase [bacterium]